MNNSLLGASAAVALLAAAPATAAGPTITYVPNSLAQSVIKNGPWTLHESAVNRDREDEDDDSHAKFAHDASGIVPTTSGPPYRGRARPMRAIVVRPAGPRSITATA